MLPTNAFFTQPNVEFTQEIGESIISSMNGRSFYPRNLRHFGMPVSIVRQKPGSPPLFLKHDVVKIDSEYFIITSEIGKGAYGKVYRGFCFRKNEWFAVKVQSPHDGSSSQIATQTSLTRKYGLGTSSTVFGPTAFYITIGNRTTLNVYVAMPLADCSLDKYIRRNFDMTLCEACEIIIQICQQLICLHEGGYCHMDIKADNVLMKDKKVYLSDFGIATPIGTVRPLSPYPSRSYPQCGPEMFIDGAMPGKRYFRTSPSFDAWGIGLLIKYCNYHVNSPVLDSLSKMYMKPNPEDRPPLQTLTHILDNIQKQLAGFPDSDEKK